MGAVRHRFAVMTEILNSAGARILHGPRLWSTTHANGAARISRYPRPHSLLLKLSCVTLFGSDFSTCDGTSACAGFMLSQAESSNLVTKACKLESRMECLRRLSKRPYSDSPLSGLSGLTPVARGLPWNQPSARGPLDSVRQRLLEERFAEASTGEAQEREGAAKEHGLPDDLFASDGKCPPAWHFSCLQR